MRANNVAKQLARQRIAELERMDFDELLTFDYDNPHEQTIEVAPGRVYEMDTSTFWDTGEGSDLCLLVHVYAPDGLRRWLPARGFAYVVPPARRSWPSSDQ